ncbi:MAG TPA: enoyl-CoA hydratase-related protein [Caulobacteraceae bacterium]|nr:enoyl-CoA hydratase-related protein [Caulobacteraceae bacterium]
MNDAVLLEVADGVAVVTLNRPERLNAVNSDLMAGLAEAVQRAVDDPEAGCIVVTGAGRGFCAGGDTKEGASGRAQAAAATPELIRGGGLRRAAEASRLLREAPKPSIAMVNGPVAGAGIGIAGACDLRFAASSATFLSAYERIGGSGDYGATFVWPRILGAAKAREIFLLGEKFTAEAALAFGIYNRVFPDQMLRAKTMEAARRLAAGPRSTWAYMKANLNAAEDESFGRHLDRESMNMGLATQAYFSALRALGQPAQA